MDENRAKLFYGNKYNSRAICPTFFSEEFRIHTYAIIKKYRGCNYPKW